jgi:hypothetical protein
MSYTLGQAAKAVGMSKRPSCEASRQAGSVQGGMNSTGQCSHAPHSAGEQKAPAVQRLYRLHTKALSAWSTFGSATRICGAFATLVRNHPNWIVVLGEKNHFGSFVRELWRPQTPSFMRIE